MTLDEFIANHYEDGTFYDKEIEGTRTSKYWLCAAYVDNEDE